MKLREVFSVFEISGGYLPFSTDQEEVICNYLLFTLRCRLSLDSLTFLDVMIL